MMKSERGSAPIGILVWIVGFFMLLSFCFVVTSILTKHDIAVTDLRSAIVSAEKANLNMQYSDMIEGESYKTSDDYDDNSYKSQFFDSLQKCFSRVTRTDTAGGVTYLVKTHSGQDAFTLEDVSVTLTVQNKTMADGKSERLVYQAAGMLSIPVSAFGFTTGITVPIETTGTFQYTG
jgi:hypothetical protein